MAHFAIPAAGTPAFDEWLAQSLTTPKPLIAKAVKAPRKHVVRRPVDLTEPVQRRGEDWISFSYRWDRSPFGRARRAAADELRATIGSDHQAERRCDDRIEDARVNRAMNHQTRPSMGGSFAPGEKSE